MTVYEGLEWRPRRGQERAHMLRVFASCVCRCVRAHAQWPSGAPDGRGTSGHLRIDIMGFEDMASPIARIVAGARRGKRARVQAPQGVLCHSASAARVAPGRQGPCAQTHAKLSRAIPSLSQGALQLRSHLRPRGILGTGPGYSIAPVPGSAAHSAQWQGSVGPRSPACAAARPERSGRQRRGRRGRTGRHGAEAPTRLYTGGEPLYMTGELTSYAW